MSVYGWADLIRNRRLVYCTLQNLQEAGGLTCNLTFQSLKILENRDCHKVLIYSFKTFIVYYFKMPSFALSSKSMCFLLLMCPMLIVFWFMCVSPLSYLVTLKGKCRAGEVSLSTLFQSGGLRICFVRAKPRTMVPTAGPPSALFFI